jgi:hypothetical protein
VRKHKCGAFTPTGKNFVSHVVGNGFAVRAAPFALQKTSQSPKLPLKYIKKIGGDKSRLCRRII